MDIWDIVKKAGKSALTSVLPGSGFVIDLVNEMLGDGDKLPSDATGEMLGAAIKTLTPEQQAQLLNREFDLEEKRIDANVALMTGPPAQVTRAWIAKWAFVLVAVVTLAAVIVWGKAAVWDKDVEVVAAVTDGWPFLAALLFPFVAWLNRYFGILRQEQRDRLAAGNGSTPVGGFANIIQTFRKGG